MSIGRCFTVFIAAPFARPSAFEEGEEAIGGFDVVYSFICGQKGLDYF